MVSYGKDFRKKGPEETVSGEGVPPERDEKKIIHDERGDVFMRKGARRFLGSERASIGKSAVRKAVPEKEVFR
jgi:hypothetical protein